MRITSEEHALHALLWPTLRPVLREYPEINVEFSTDYALTDIVAERFDAGVRRGAIVAKDMIAVPIGAPMRAVTVASPAYLAERQLPKTPDDLAGHSCINFRLPTSGRLPTWDYRKGARELQVRVQGQLVFNSVSSILEASLDGFGLAYLQNSLVQPFLDSGELREVLADWSLPFPGYHLYYPNRRQPTAAFNMVVEALRYRGR